MSRDLAWRDLTSSIRAINMPAMADKQSDHLDEQLDVWVREIPGLDRLTEGIVERIEKLSRYFGHTMETTLAEYELSHRTFRVLGRLRYQGAPYQLSAGQLAESMGLSSGAMTNRLDRLEQAGLVRRLAGSRRPARRPGRANRGGARGMESCCAHPGGARVTRRVGALRNGEGAAA